MQEHRVDYLEQPVKRNDLVGMAAIKRAATGVPLMADEACLSIQDAHNIIAAIADAVLCIKLYKHGGITPARKIAAIAEAANIKINCGGLAVLSQLEAAAGAHFYASRPAEHVMPAGEFIFGLGVIGPDPLVPNTDFVVKDGHVAPPSGPGLGITVDEKALGVADTAQRGRDEMTTAVTPRLWRMGIGADARRCTERRRRTSQTLYVLGFHRLRHLRRHAVVEPDRQRCLGVILEGRIVVAVRAQR